MKMMMVVCAMFLVLAAQFTLADDMVIYPAQGQSSEQQKTDEGACYVWAKDQTGFDPAAPIEAVAEPKKKRGGALRGAAIGAIVGDDSDAAKTGAAIGATRQGFKNRRAEKAADKANAALEAERAANFKQFNKATAACLEGKGYVVK